MSAPRYLGRARIRGVLYDLGSYPGLALGGTDPDPVPGDVYAITPELERQLDVIEAVAPVSSGEYARRHVDSFSTAGLCAVWSTKSIRSACGAGRASPRGIGNGVADACLSVPHPVSCNAGPGRGGLSWLHFKASPFCFII